MSTYIVKSSAAKMPASCWGSYRRVAVLEVEDGVEDVAMISDRARGAIRVVRIWEKRHVGSTSRCAFERALQDACDLRDRLIAESSTTVAA